MSKTKGIFILIGFFMFISIVSATITSNSPSNGSTFIHVSPTFNATIDIPVIASGLCLNEDCSYVSEREGGELYIQSIDLGNFVVGLNNFQAFFFDENFDYYADLQYFYYYDVSPFPPTVYLYPQQNSTNNLTNDRSFIFNVSSGNTISYCELYINNTYIKSNETNMNTATNNTINYSGLTVGNFSSYILCADTVGLNNTSNNVTFSIFPAPTPPVTSTCTPTQFVLFNLLGLIIPIMLLVMIFNSNDKTDILMGKVLMLIIIILVTIYLIASIC